MGYKPENSKIEAVKAYAWYKEARDYLSKPMQASITDCRYYDNEQWTKAEKEAMKDRGQPPLVINCVKPALDLVLGTETSIRVDYKAFPRTSAHNKDANVVTHLMKHVMDQCGGEYVHSGAFEGMSKAGWAVVEICKGEDPFKDPVMIRLEDRRYFFYDPYAKEYDRQDAKYMGRSRWLDLEDAEAMFPQHKEELRRAVEGTEPAFQVHPYQMTGDEIDPHGTVLDWEDKGIGAKDWIDKGRKRLRLLEVWYKVPVKILILENLMTGDKEELDKSPGSLQKMLDPNTKLIETTIKKVRMAIIAGPNVLEDRWSPYRHNRYPFVIYWAFNKDETREPYGLIRQMRDPQDEVNKRRSKALHILNTKRVIADANAVKDHDEARKEVSRPDSYLIIDNPEAKFEVSEDINLAEAQFKLLQEAKDEINRPVPLELMGHQTNAQSGKAIEKRQVSGHMMLATVFDHYKRSRQLIGEQMWSLIQQYYTTPHIIRILDRAGNFDFVTINEQVTDKETGQVYIRNDISRTKVDIKIDEQAYNTTVRETLMAQMTELVGKLSQSMPQVALALLDMVASYSDFPERDEMVRRIQQIQASMGMGPAAQGEPGMATA